MTFDLSVRPVRGPSNAPKVEAAKKANKWKTFDAIMTGAAIDETVLV